MEDVSWVNGSPGINVPVVLRVEDMAGVLEASPDGVP